MATAPPAAASTPPPPLFAVGLRFALSFGAAEFRLRLGLCAGRRFPLIVAPRRDRPAAVLGCGRFTFAALAAAPPAPPAPALASVALALARRRLRREPAAGVLIVLAYLLNTRGLFVLVC